MNKLFNNTNNSNSDFSASETEEEHMKNITVDIKDTNLFPIDIIFINLKVLSKIKKNDKLIVLDNTLSTDNRFFQFIRRYISDDDRLKMIEHIDKIFNDSFQYYNYANNNYILPSDISIENNRSFKDRLVREIKNCQSGLQNIRYTYKEDLNISSKIDYIIDKCNIYITNK